MHPSQGKATAIDGLDMDKPGLADIAAIEIVVADR